MADFNLYFRLGTHHILTWEALDHILFVTALCLRYQLKEWKKVVLLVTAFTIGHSLTLALGALGYVHFARNWIEFLIPLTIFATALNNLYQSPAKPVNSSGLPLIYFFALFFGLIHGLAFANTFISLEGREDLVAHLFAFNVGIEAAQLLIVAIVLGISYIILNILKLSSKGWLNIMSILIILASIKMAVERWPYNNQLHT